MSGCIHEKRSLVKDRKDNSPHMWTDDEQNLNFTELRCTAELKCHVIKNSLLLLTVYVCGI